MCIRDRIYGAIQSPLAQPRNLIGGHLISALIGVSIYKIIPEPIWLSAPLAVSISILAMQYTKTLHPPGGATAVSYTHLDVYKRQEIWYRLLLSR